MLEFKPQLSPKEMLELGVFGGWYFKTEDNMKEFPADWFKNAKLSQNGFNVNLNKFGVASGQSMEVWISKGWITSDDPLGWFQWYCRYHMGRRIPDVDLFQIKHYNNFGPRHAGAIRKHCPGQYHKRTKQRQALLQWAYDPFI